MTRSWTGLLAALALLTSVGATQQPAEHDAPPPSGERAEPATAPEPSPERVRERIQRRIDELDRERARLGRVLAAIEDGRPLRELLENMRPEDRRYMEWRPGARRGTDAGGTPPESDAPPPTSDEIRAFIAEHMPELARNLEVVEQVEPDGDKGAERIVRMLSPRISEVIIAQRRDEKLGELKLRELKMAGRVLDATRGARDHLGKDGELTQSDENILRTSLVQLLTDQARIRDDVRLREIELLETRTESMRAEVLAHAEGRDAEIERMADRMIARIKGSRDWRGDGRGRRPDRSRGEDADD